MKSLLKLLVGLALSALTLFLFLRNLDLEKVRSGLAHASVPLLLLAILIGYFGHLAARSMRWATMLRPLKRGTSFYNLFSTTAIGYAVSWLAPGRVGEVVRPVLLGRREGIPVAGVLATAGLERILDLVAVLVLGAVAALTAPLWWGAGAQSAILNLPGLGPKPIAQAVAILGGVGLAACALGLWIARALLREDGWLARLLARRETAAGSGWSRALWGFCRHLALGASFLRDARTALRVGAESLLIWVVIGASTWIGLLAAGVRIPFAGVFVLLVPTVIGIAVPTPGGAGSVHVAFQWGLTEIFRIDANRAAVATVLYHPIIVFIPPVLFGLLFAWRDGLTPGRLKNLAAAARKEQSAAEPPALAMPGREEGGRAAATMRREPRPEGGRGLR